MKKIGILTSGGDCPGLNAIIRAVTLCGRKYGWQVDGFLNGTLSLLERPVAVKELTSAFGGLGDFMVQLGGTMLGSNNWGNPFNYPMADGTRQDRSVESIEGLKMLELDGLISVGGDGSLEILPKLASLAGLPLICIPKTIDNDVGGTEYSIGYSTAVEVATQALDELRATAASHNRLMILEVMGRDAGHIALAAGIAGGADVILLPEVPYKMEIILDAIQKARTRHGGYALMVVTESVRLENGAPLFQADGLGHRRYGGIGHYMAERLAVLSGIEARATVLGHVQRGASPDPWDRLLGASFGVRAVELLAEGKSHRMVAWRGGRVTDISLEEVAVSLKAIDLNGTLVSTARGLGICLGDE